VGTARRFDAPEAASFFNLAALRASLEFLSGYGVEAIHTHIQELLGILEAGLPAPYRRRAPRGRVPGPILCIESEDIERLHADYRRVRDAGIWVSLREDGIRVSPHLFNTEADIDRFLTVLGSA
jgi:selenocysteine lyase/cysteine desulfurase